MPKIEARAHITTTWISKALNFKNLDQNVEACVLLSMDNEIKVVIW